MAAVRSRSLRARATKQHSYGWLQGLLCGVAAALFPGPALLVGFLLAPGLIALTLDHETGKPTARAILLLGAAATIPPLVRLWHGSAALGAAVALLDDPAVLGAAWLLAACGWLLSQFVPLVVRYALDAAAVARVARLNGERARLAEAWGLTAELDAEPTVKPQPATSPASPDGAPRPSPS